MRVPRWLHCVVGVGACMLVGNYAGAANIAIDDLTDNIAITPDTNFEFGFSSMVSGETGSFSGSWVANTGSSGSGTVFMTEGNTGLISDELQVNFTWNPDSHIATINGTFVSDAETPLGVLPPGLPHVIEDGTSQPVTGLFVSPASGGLVTIPSNLTIEIASDVEAPVAEPTSLLLLGSGLAGLFGARRRSRLHRRPSMQAV